jgi:DNA invertase Pin-like site-specific DNA recombinase
LTSLDNPGADIRCITEAEKHSTSLVGYARVSTDGQTLDAQLASLKAAGATKVFSEKQSGAKTDRRQLGNAIAALGVGDVLLVTRLDRLARSTRDLLNVLATLADKGAGFRSLADTWADTTTAHGRLMLTVLGGLAEFERELIKARTGEGRRRAKDRGVRFGRKPKLTAFQIAEALQRKANGEHLADIGRSYGVSHSTISRL